MRLLALAGVLAAALPSPLLACGHDAERAVIERVESYRAPRELVIVERVEADDYHAPERVVVERVRDHDRQQIVVRERQRFAQQRERVVVRERVEDHGGRQRITVENDRGGLLGRLRGRNRQTITVEN